MKDIAVNSSEERFAVVLNRFANEAHHSFHELLTQFSQIQYDFGDLVEFFKDECTVTTSEDFFGSFAIFLQHLERTKETSFSVHQNRKERTEFKVPKHRHSVTAFTGLQDKQQPQQTSSVRKSSVPVRSPIQETISNTKYKFSEYNLYDFNQRNPKSTSPKPLVGNSSYTVNRSFSDNSFSTKATIKNYNSSVNNNGSNNNFSKSQLAGEEIIENVDIPKDECRSASPHFNFKQYTNSNNLSSKHRRKLKEVEEDRIESTELTNAETAVELQDIFLSSHSSSENENTKATKVDYFVVVVKTPEEELQRVSCIIEPTLENISEAKIVTNNGMMTIGEEDKVTVHSTPVLVEKILHSSPRQFVSSSSLVDIVRPIPDEKCKTTNSSDSSYEEYHENINNNNDENTYVDFDHKNAHCEENSSQITDETTQHDENIAVVLGEKAAHDAALKLSRSPMLNARKLNQVISKLEEVKIKQQQWKSGRKITEHEQPLYYQVMKETIEEYEKQRNKNQLLEQQQMLGTSPSLTRKIATHTAPNFLHIMEQKLCDNNIDVGNEYGGSIKNTRGNRRPSLHEPAYAAVIRQTLLDYEKRKKEHSDDKRNLLETRTNHTGSGRHTPNLMMMFDSKLAGNQLMKQTNTENTTSDDDEEPLYAQVIKSALKEHRQSLSCCNKDKLLCGKIESNKPTLELHSLIEADNSKQTVPNHSRSSSDLSVASEEVQEINKKFFASANRNTHDVHYDNAGNAEDPGFLAYNGSRPALPVIPPPDYGEIDEQLPSLPEEKEPVTVISSIQESPHPHHIDRLFWTSYSGENNSAGNKQTLTSDQTPESSTKPIQETSSGRKVSNSVLADHVIIEDTELEQRRSINTNISTTVPADITYDNNSDSKTNNNNNNDDGVNNICDNNSCSTTLSTNNKSNNKLTNLDEAELFIPVSSLIQQKDSSGTTTTSTIQNTMNDNSDNSSSKLPYNVTSTSKLDVIELGDAAFIDKPPQKTPELESSSYLVSPPHLTDMAPLQATDISPPSIEPRLNLTTTSEVARPPPLVLPPRASAKQQGVEPTVPIFDRSKKPSITNKLKVDIPMQEATETKNSDFHGNNSISPTFPSPDYSPISSPEPERRSDHYIQSSPQNTSPLLDSTEDYRPSSTSSSTSSHPGSMVAAGNVQGVSSSPILLEKQVIQFITETDEDFFASAEKPDETTEKTTETTEKPSEKNPKQPQSIPVPAYSPPIPVRSRNTGMLPIEKADTPERLINSKSDYATSDHLIMSPLPPREKIEEPLSHLSTPGDSMDLPPVPILDRSKKPQKRK